MSKPFEKNATDLFHFAVEMGFEEGMTEAEIGRASCRERV